MDKSEAWGCPCHPKKYPRSTSVKAWGCPRGTPFFIGKNQVTFQDTIFLLLHALCVFLGASLLLLSVFFCFVCCNKWLDHIMFLLEEMNSFFICQEHSSFHSYRFNDCSLFVLLRLVFVFCLDLCSDLDLSLHQGVFFPLIFIGFHQKRCL
jgi:hypothetical protein